MGHYSGERAQGSHHSVCIFLSVSFGEVSQLRAVLVSSSPEVSVSSTPENKPPDIHLRIQFLLTLLTDFILASHSIPTFTGGPCVANSWILGGSMVDSWFSPLLLSSIYFIPQIKLLCSCLFFLILAELYLKKKNPFAIVLVGVQKEYN